MDLHIDPAAVLDGIGDALVVSDLQGNEIVWNAGAERFAQDRALRKRIADLEAKLPAASAGG